MRFRSVQSRPSYRRSHLPQRAAGTVPRWRCSDPCTAAGGCAAPVRCGPLMRCRRVSPLASRAVAITTRRRLAAPPPRRRTRSAWLFFLADPLMTAADCCTDWQRAPLTSTCTLQRRHFRRLRTPSKVPAAAAAAAVPVPPSTARVLYGRASAWTRSHDAPAKVYGWIVLRGRTEWSQRPAVPPRTGGVLLVPLALGRSSCRDGGPAQHQHRALC